MIQWRRRILATGNDGMAVELDLDSDTSDEGDDVGRECMLSQVLAVVGIASVLGFIGLVALEFHTPQNSMLTLVQESRDEGTLPMFAWRTESDVLASEDALDALIQGSVPSAMWLHYKGTMALLLRLLHPNPTIQVDAVRHQTAWRRSLLHETPPSISAASNELLTSHILRCSTFLDLDAWMACRRDDHRLLWKADARSLSQIAEREHLLASLEDLSIPARWPRLEDLVCSTPHGLSPIDIWFALAGLYPQIRAMQCSDNDTTLWHPRVHLCRFQVHNSASNESADYQLLLDYSDTLDSRHDVFFPLMHHGGSHGHHEAGIVVGRTVQNAGVSYTSRVV
ncbi:hypothetical protein, variant 2 [Aphanomyces invadans]|uniref:Uncharacterized protein n=1 Tax=Aphanomyces invadans TaxID=157072 RepID=A0A024U543_9STRA|nr:hypothetical protein, variant 1 [Aphanomyces invadans]XP_008869370.1 hypothetical protein, variant 2 [Aphanomyces invadans]ETW01521.1 hypothetical protein, variant 1 [Aphanomyces invadans]ETW01522.1 hypothetical protein, variant 2 [Aphanomyces invadans]|eukprot:XP_008869369.1 hypothetical protein, variant 1 [Aphanomyces invadans]